MSGEAGGSGDSGVGAGGGDSGIGYAAESGGGMSAPPLMGIDDASKSRALDLPSAPALSDAPATVFEAGEIITQQDGTVVWRIRGTARA